MRETTIIIGADTEREGDAMEEVDISRNPSKPISRPPSAPRLLDLSTTTSQNSVTNKLPENGDTQIAQSNEESTIDQTSGNHEESRTTNNEDLQINSASKVINNEELTIQLQDSGICQGPEDAGQVETEKLIVGEQSKIDEPTCTRSENPTLSRKFIVNSKSNQEVVISIRQDVAGTDNVEEKVTNQTSESKVSSSPSNNAMSSLNQIDPIAEGSYGFIFGGQPVRSTNNALVTMLEPRSNNICADPDVDDANVDKIPYIIRPVTKWSLEGASGADTPTNSNEKCNPPRARSATDVLEVREFKHLWMMTPDLPKAVPTLSEERMIGRGVIPVAPETTSENTQDTLRPPSAPVVSDSVTESAAAATVLPNLAAAMNLIVPALKRNSWLKEPKITVPDATGSVQTSQSDNVSKNTATPILSTEVVSQSFDEPGSNLTKQTSITRMPSKSKVEPSDQITDSSNTVTGNAVPPSQTSSTSDEKSSSHSMIARGCTTAKHVYDMLRINKNLQISTVIPLPLTPVPSPTPRRRRDPASYRHSTPRTPPPRQQDQQRPHRPRGYEGMPSERRGHRRSERSRRRSGPPRPPAPLPANRPRRDRPRGPLGCILNVHDCCLFTVYVAYFSHYSCSIFLFPFVGTHSPYFQEYFNKCNTFQSSSKFSKKEHMFKKVSELCRSNTIATYWFDGKCFLTFPVLPLQPMTVQGHTTLTTQTAQPQRCRFCRWRQDTVRPKISIATTMKMISQPFLLVILCNISTGNVITTNNITGLLQSWGKN